jgi:ADP-heptose:LPS heptosyltransferase
MEKVLIYRLGSLGDTVAALPCFHLIERSFPDAERHVLTNVIVSSKAAPLEVILREGGFIHGSIAYPIGVRNPIALGRLALKLRRHGARTLVYLAESRGLATARRDVAFFRFCGFRQIIGAPLTEDLQRPRRDEQGELERESRRLGRALAELGTIDFADRSWWDLRLTDAERATGQAALGPLAGAPFVVVNTGGKVVEKDWGEANWSALLEALSERLAGHGLAFVGAPDDRDQAATLGASWSAGPVVNLCGNLLPRESAAAVEQARLFLGHDSGPLHMADAVRTPAIGLFGDYNEPKQWHPEGGSTRIIHRMQGLSRITPIEVLETARELLDQPAASSRTR